MGQNVIELNGKRYDAITGAYLGKAAHPAVQAAMHGRVIDGFVRPAHPAPAKPKTGVPVLAHATTHHAAPKPIAPAPKHTIGGKFEHPGPKPVGRHQPQHAKTLMRRAVHKPVVSLKPAIKLQAPAEIMAKPHSALVHKRSAISVDPSRLERAAHIDKHQAVRHFRPMHRPELIHGVSGAVSEVPVIAVQPAPVHIARPIQPAPRHHVDAFEAAIAHATSHQQPKHIPHKQRVHRRLVNTLAIVGAFLIIGGFVGYLNMSGIELRVASMQAGFHASMPAYTPTGYALTGGIQRTGGTVRLSFHSGDSHYVVTQQASDWNSQTLLDNTLALADSHKTVQKNGQTIYIYGNGSNASWVNGGIRYDVAGNAQLSTDELTAIATSL